MVFQEKWIKVGADKEMNSFARENGRLIAGIHANLSEEEVQEMGRKVERNGDMSNSQIRNIYGEIKRIQMIGNFDKAKTSFYLLKPKLAYAFGRNSSNSGLKLFKKIFDEASQYVIDDRTYNNFCNLMEAILAYHRAYGGK
jgi:CRISPR-associated protein Csm2